MRSYIALDIGGTQIKAGIISEEFVLQSKITSFDAHAKEDASTIIENFIHIIRTMLTTAEKNHLPIHGIGIAFPGPFDYQSGISLMSGINKYDAIYGINLKKVLSSELHFSENRIAFMNDADLFCLGEATFGLGLPYTRSMMICIGTGLGSGFIACGKLIKDGDSVPENGWIYSLPYKDGIIDAYLSATGIENMIKNSGAFSPQTTVRSLAGLARSGNEEAKRIFNAFGEDLAEAILPIALRFRAECLIIGGQVAKSYDLFYHKLKCELARKNIITLISKDSTVSAMRAVPLLFSSHQEMIMEDQRRE